MINQIEKNFDPGKKLSYRMILLTGSLLVRISVAVAFWQFTHSDSRLTGGIAIVALTVISWLAAVLGHLAVAKPNAAPETRTTSVFRFS